MAVTQHSNIITLSPLRHASATQSHHQLSPKPQKRGKPLQESLHRSRYFIICSSLFKLGSRMKPNPQKLKMTRKSSASSSTSKEKMPPQENKEEKLRELREKIEKDRELMRKTGKRFSKMGESTSSIKSIEKQQSSSISKKTEKETGPNAFAKKENRLVEISVGKQDSITSHLNQSSSKQTVVVKQKINLTDLAIDSQITSMENSRLFDRQIQQQKSRNNQIYKFMGDIGLNQFADGLINMGYDDLEVLVEVKSEELNFLMMRAFQQKKFLEAVEKYKKYNGLQSTQSQDLITSKPALFKTKTKMNFKPKEESVSPPIQSRPKSAVTEASTVQTNNSAVLQNNSSFFANPSFFCSLGANDWSLESLTRRACSSCFKVVEATDLQKINDCYYCVKCKEKQNDMLDISLNESMIRNYKL